MTRQHPGAMTERQRRFAEEYIVDGNATQAALRAGYSVIGSRTQGSRLLSNPLIRASIDEANGKRSAAVEITQQDVLRKLLDTYTNAGAAGQFTAQARAAELLGRHLAMFTDKVVVDDRRMMTDADLIDVLASGDADKVKLLRSMLGVASDKPLPKVINNPE